jgi:hypothetical protein
LAAASSPSSTPSSSRPAGPRASALADIGAERQQQSWARAEEMEAQQIVVVCS